MQTEGEGEPNRAVNAARRQDLAVDDAAVDEDRLTGNVVRVRAGEIGDQACHVVRGFGTAQRDAFHVFLVGFTYRRAGDLGETLVDLGPHAGTDNPRTVGVYRDAAAGVLFGRRLGQRADGKFGGGVDPQQGEPIVPGNGAGVDDFTFLLTVDEFFAAA